MGIFSKLFSHKNDDKKVGGMEDYMTLVRVYFQAALASQLGITNLAMLPDLRVFKTSLHVPTVNNRLGIGEKAQVKKMMKNIYDTDDSFFKEIDSSIRKNCQKLEHSLQCAGIAVIILVEDIIYSLCCQLDEVQAALA